MTPVIEPFMQIVPLMFAAELLKQLLILDSPSGRIEGPHKLNPRVYQSARWLDDVPRMRETNRLSDTVVPVPAYRAFRNTGWTWFRNRWALRSRR